MTDTVRQTSELISLMQPIPTSPAKSTNRQLLRDVVKSFDVVRSMFVNVKDAPYNAAGDGVTDDTIAVQAAITAATNAGGGTVFFPRGTYLITGMLSTTDGIPVRILGGGDSSIIKKGFNGDMLSLGMRSTIREVYLDGNGANFTGRGIIVTTGANDVVSWRRFRDVWIMDTASYCIEFTAPIAGFMSNGIGCHFRVYNSTIYAIKMPTAAETNGNRTFTDCKAPSGGLCDLGGSQNSGFVNCESGGATLNDAFLFTANTIKARIIGNRLGNNTSMTVLGTENIVVGNVSPTPIILGAGASGCTIGPNGNAATVTDNSGNTTNLVYDSGLTPFTPVWTCASGAAPALGNGSLNANFTRHGKKVTLWIEFQAGTTTTFGGGNWEFSLPLAANSGREFVGCQYILNSGVAFEQGYCVINTAKPTVVRPAYPNGAGSVTASTPHVWKSGDRLTLEITYSL